MPAYTARITRVVDHGHDTKSLFLARPDGFRFDAGQFVSCQLPIDGATVAKPYTIASPTGVDELEILFNHLPGGVASTYLWERRAGDVLPFTGPWGTFTLDAPPTVPTVFIAEGPGIAAIRPLLYAAARPDGPPLSLLYATALPLYHDELAQLPGVTMQVIAPGALDAAVRAQWIDADAARDRQFFICGIGALVPALRDALRHAGYARRAVRYEKW